MKILVTGAAGYIGSHCALTLLQKNFKVIAFDNLSTGHIETIETLKKFGNLTFFQGDLINKDDLKNLFLQNKIDIVLHFAGLSQVEESTKYPEKYFLNNVEGTKNLLDEMIKNNVKKIVFSSTASIYGEPKYIPIDENHPKNPTNTYGKTKLSIENLLNEYDKNHNLKSVSLRYFNVIGANKNALLGECHEPETHLIPNILKTYFDDNKTFKIYGNNFETKDGTCIRDYIDVNDLINAHLLALSYLIKNNQTNCFNLGSNNGYSVKEIFSTCKEVLKKEIRFETHSKREGDVAKLIADNKKAKEILGWAPKISLNESIINALNWEKKRNNIN